MKPKLVPMLVITSMMIALFPKPAARANPAAIPAVAGCAAQPVICVLSVVVLSGTTYYVVKRQGRPVEYYPMLDNPENQTAEWENDPFYAANEAQARIYCEKVAASKSREWKTRVTLKRVQRVNRAKFKCVFEYEV